MIRYLIKFFLAITLIIVGCYLVSDNLQPEIIGAGILLLVDLLILDAFFDLITNWKRVSLVLKCKYLSINDHYIRFSMSYLYRIKVNDKYLLVKSSNFPHYQLVGGKYKRLKGTQSLLKKEFEAKDDAKLATSGLMKHDYALYVPAKNAIKFLDWFNTKQDREISHWREFYEELIAGKGEILSRENFPYVNYNYVGTITTPVKRTPGWDTYEILQYDILDLIPTPKQEKELEKLLEKGDTEYLKWADTELINSLGHCKREQKQLYKIGEHTKWALNMKWSKD
ncbi:hypothetical protein [Flavobacterium sp. N2038]|uniref:SMODS-associated NUDIX domain-containing protein n=1 Tax=Flavobacterium sp. N2038 TaxID=2986829 RepID=UPI0022240A9E|nr:hypothetical protein [Flavobacterium sp. N2038]